MSLLPLHVVHGEISVVDILAIGPHPDDIEIGAAGALLSWGARGYRIGLADLTRGELGTKGNAETRLEESAEAARRLDAAFRVNFSFPDGGVADSDENRMRVAALLRETRPRWVLANLEEDLHPDHAAGARLVKAAFFLSRLPKYLPEIPAHSPDRLLFYLIHTQAAPSFLVDIGAVLEKKLEVMKAYASQFIEPELPEGYRYTGLHDYLANVRALNDAWGAQGGVPAAEAFLTAKPLVLNDLECR